MGFICGFITNQFKEKIHPAINDMINTMVFRGADFTASYVKDNIGFGVGINKTSGSMNQPVMNETSDIIAICDGEIYNYKDIESKLLAKGHKLKTGSSMEVITHLYEELGNDFAAELNGIFSIALYDKRFGRFLLVRDHLGSRSVFYAIKGSTLLFASTIKALLSMNIVDKSLSKTAIDLYFAGTCVPHPYTMFQEIKNVRPGYAIIWEADSLREHEYWSLSNVVEDYNTNEDDFQDRIRELVLDAIKIRIINEEPFGSILSGGVDSSLICSVLAHMHVGKVLQTFSIGYDEESFDDSFLQEIMLNKYDLTKNRIFLREEMAIDLLKKVVMNSDYPINNASAMGTYLCMKHVKYAGLKRIFDGEAADEIFCGGGGVVGENLVELFERIPQFCRKLLFSPFAGSLQMNKVGKVAAFRRLCQRICMPPIERMLTWLPAFDPASRQDLFTGEFKQHLGNSDEFEPGKFYMQHASFKDGINLYQYGACKTYLPNDLLFKNERMAAANGITNVTPFIDYRLVELAFQIPAKYKLKGITTKSAEKKLIYRRAIKGIIPDEILWRKKIRGFSQPTSLWMRKSLKDFVLEIILSKRTINRGILNPTFLKSIIEEHISGRGDHDRLLWGIITFELWMREFVD